MEIYLKKVISLYFYALLAYWVLTNRLKTLHLKEENFK